MNTYKWKETWSIFVTISFYDTAEDLQTLEQRKFCQQEKNDQTTTHDIVTEKKHQHDGTE